MLLNFKAIDAPAPKPTLGDLAYGQAFRYSGSYYMKTENASGGGSGSGVRLSSGLITYLGESTIVEPYKATVMLSPRDGG